jgi:hypothetical protein
MTSINTDSLTVEFSKYTLDAHWSMGNSLSKQVTCVHDGICDTDAFDSDPDPSGEIIIQPKVSPKTPEAPSAKKKKKNKHNHSGDTSQSIGQLFATVNSNLEEQNSENNSHIPAKTHSWINKLNKGKSYNYNNGNRGNYDPSTIFFANEGDSLIDESTPNFESETSNKINSLVQELNLKKYTKSSTFDKFRSPTKSQAPIFEYIHTNAEMPDPFITPTKNEILDTLKSLNESSLGKSKSSAIIKPGTTDFHLASNSRRKRGLSRSKIQIDTIYSQLCDHHEEEPDEKENVIEFPYEKMFINSEKDYMRPNISQKSPCFKTENKTDDSSSIQRHQRDFSYNNNRSYGSTFTDMKKSYISKPFITPEKSQNIAPYTIRQSYSGVYLRPDDHNNTSSKRSGSIGVSKICTYDFSGKIVKIDEVLYGDGL